MVGDRLFDIDGAHESGIKCCAVLWGYGNRDELEKHKADFIIEVPKDILSLL
jgi:phosphoglycolate phosphatase